MFPGSFFAPGPVASGIGIGDAAPTFPYLKMLGYCSPGAYSTERVPAGVRTILVMVFGGGGNGFVSTTVAGDARCGAGGGFSMAEFPVTPGDLLPPIVIGSIAGTSSFGPYLSSTGGSSATAGVHGVGGIGSFAPGLQNAVAYPGGSPSGPIGSYMQGGASSGSPYGPGSGPGSNNSGGAGWTLFGVAGNNTLGGSGIFACSDTTNYGPGGGGSASANSGADGGRGRVEQANYGLVTTANQGIDISSASVTNDLMLILQLLKRGGAGGGGIYFNNTYNLSVGSRAGNGGAGAGGGGIIFQGGGNAQFYIAGDGGIGGGGGGIYAQSTTNPMRAGRGGFGAGGGSLYVTSTSATTNVIGGDGGIAGGGGSFYWSGTFPTGIARAGRGGTGAVLIFYTEGY